MGKGTTSRVAVDRVLLGVVARFVAYFAVLVVGIIAIDIAGGWEPTLVFTARVCAQIAHAIGIPSALSGTHIDVGNRVLSVDLPCTAIFIMALFSALVLAYPVSLKLRLIGVAAGLPIIAVVNIGRIVAAAGISVSMPSAFSFFHDYLFQVGMVGVTVAIWAGWLALARQHAR